MVGLVIQHSLQSGDRQLIFVYILKCAHLQLRQNNFRNNLNRDVSSSNQTNNAFLVPESAPKILSGLRVNLQ